MATEAERTALWREWLETDEGKGYEAGWGDYYNQLLAQKGKTWVAERMLEGAEAELARLRASLTVVYHSLRVADLKDEADAPCAAEAHRLEASQAAALALGEPVPSVYGDAEAAVRREIMGQERLRGLAASRDEAEAERDQAREALKRCWDAAGLLCPDMTGKPDQAWEDSDDLIAEIYDLSSRADNADASGEDGD